MQTFHFAHYYVTPSRKKWNTERRNNSKDKEETSAWLFLLWSCLLILILTFLIYIFSNIKNYDANQRYHDEKLINSRKSFICHEIGENDGGDWCEVPRYPLKY